VNTSSTRGGPSFGAHAFIWAGEWSREGAERVISGAAAAGLDFVEIPLLDPKTMDVEYPSTPMAPSASWPTRSS
jgi:hypothetical protein